MERRVVPTAFLAILIACSGQPTHGSASSFVNFETPPVQPIALSPDGSRLAVCNLSAGRLEIFDVGSGTAVSLGSVPVGIDPVSVRFLTPGEAWVVNHISDSISVVDVEGRRVVATLQTLDTPADVIFAGSPRRAYVSCAMPNTVQVFDPVTRQLVTNLVIEAERPKALATSPDGRKVYAAIFESGNATTIVGARLEGLSYFGNVVSLPTGPYGGKNPPPNSGTNLSPSLNIALSNAPAPTTGLIVRKNSEGRWVDDNQRDWTQYVSGTNASLTRRVPGWDLPDRDVAIIDTEDFSVTYATGLMNLCMGIAVNPASGQITVVGTDAINDVRFEPNLNGIFVRAKIGLVDPFTLTTTVKDLNPHLDYATRTLPQSERDKSIGEPRGIVWNAGGTRGYVTGMGSRNLVVIDTAGNRARPLPIELQEGPIGLALDEAHERLYVLNRFSASLSIVNTDTDRLLTNVPLFDPTPRAVKAGRRHLYDTRRTSGLGQASCASCHPDARMDRLGWDLGDPSGELTQTTINLLGNLQPTIYHPMKGVMMTQTLQDILGHEPFHWRGDRPFIESFNQTFINLMAASTALTASEMRELRDFLGTIRLPPNPYRTFVNGLSTNLPLPGHWSQGNGGSTAGTPLPNGNAQAGLQRFRVNAICTTCHTLPTGLGFDYTNNNSGIRVPYLGTNGEHHVANYFRLEGGLPSKIAQFRNMPDKVGMDGTHTQSRAGFGFGHDGSVDSLERFIFNVGAGDFRADQDMANIVAFILSVSGSDLPQPNTSDNFRLLPGPSSQDVPAAVGKQITLESPLRVPLLDAMLALADSPTSRVDLIAKGLTEGAVRGWFYDRSMGLFQSDRRNETLSPDALIDLAGAGRELTFTVVSRGTGQRLGIDRDDDGVYDGDELDAGTNPDDWGFIYLVSPPQPTEVIVHSNASLRVVADSTHWDFYYQWFKEGVALLDATNDVLALTDVPFTATGNYSVLVGNAARAVTSVPVRLKVVPLLASIVPTNLIAQTTSNATFTASAIGEGPFSYQWLRDGAEVPYATSSTLTLTNVQLADEVPYTVAVANANGTYTTKPASLTVRSRPGFIIPPQDQEVLAGGQATFSVVISGNPPPFGYQLRRGGEILTNFVTNERFVFLTFPNVQPTNVGPYFRIVVTNSASAPLGTSSDPVTITVLADSDNDGLPDLWEAAHGLNTNDPVDAQLDSDLDRQSNWQEYIAGTDPFDPRSNLRIESLILGGQTHDELLLSFEAVSNRTYTVQIRDRFDSGPWTRWKDLVAYPTNRFVTLTNPLPAGTGSRAYRLVTPRAP
jgi:YVTN family beta-propeller protein